MILSVIMPCYNGANYVEQAIQSVLKMNSQQIELIVVNDGSTDNTEEVCLKYINKIKYIKTENRGAAHARNIGIRNATGIYVSFCDCDDVYMEGSISDDRLGFLCLCNEKGINIIRTCRAKTNMEMTLTPVIAYPEETILYCLPDLEFWTCIYRRVFLVSNELFFYEFRLQDVESSFRMKVFSSCTADTVITDKSWVFYLQRNNPDSNTHTWKVPILYYAKASAFLDLFLFADRKSILTDKPKREFLTFLAQISALYILRFKKVKKDAIAIYNLPKNDVCGLFRNWSLVKSKLTIYQKIEVCAYLIKNNVAYLLGMTK